MESGSVTEVSTGFNYVEDDLTKRKCFCDLCRTDERTGVGDDYDNEKISYHDKTEALEAELTISNYNVHIRILYGIISILLVLILYGFWSQRQDMATLRSECLTDSRPFSVQNFGSVFNNSDLYLSGPGNRIRQKRHAIGSMQNLQNQILQLRRRQKRSDMASTLHEYCMTVYNLCESKPVPGPPGVPVATGPPGPPGPQGPKGEQGVKGEKGPPGRFGFDGIPGSPGGKGERGDKGERGLIGFMGDKGEIGYPGPKGTSGDTGPPGPRGHPGPKGSQGPEGPTGPKGNDGRRGRNGDTGPSGEKGKRGTDGIPGVPGFKGIKGDRGDRGSPGYGINCICEKGTKGEKGQRGLVGFTGYKGDKGVKGQKGIQGYGLKGEEGERGPRGIKGERGQKGDCDLWEKDRKSWQVVNIDHNGDDRELSETPQQDYQAHDDRRKTSNTRGSRSSNTAVSVNLAAGLISSFIPIILTITVHLPLKILNSL